MNPNAYTEMAETESTHWWFKGRRDIIRRLLLGITEKNKRYSILEIGCGTGGNLSLLSEFGSVKAIECDSSARKIALQKTNSEIQIEYGLCPKDLPYSGQKFDIVCMFDVLEHIREDSETLIAIREFLAENGKVIITVPAFQWLYGKHDRYLHHERRYSLNSLLAKVESAGFTYIKISYFNCFLFPLAATVRIMDKIIKSQKISENKIPPNFLNNILYQIFRFEGFLLPFIKIPFGLSIFIILKSK